MVASRDYRSNGASSLESRHFPRRTLTSDCAPAKLVFEKAAILKDFQFGRMSGLQAVASRFMRGIARPGLQFFRWLFEIR
jgi:hypothetical protein